MTDPVSIGLTVGAAVTAVLAAWLQFPSAPDLDGERWFKVILATLMLGEVEAGGGEESVWVERVLRFVPYHPAGRFPERKAVQPIFDPPGKRLPGEQALQEKLATRPTLEERWALLFDEDEAGIAARLEDPVELGPAYDPAELVGRGLGWDAIAKWGAGEVAFREALLRRVGARWVLLEGPPEGAPGPTLAEALQAEIPDLVRIPWDAGTEGGGLAGQVERADKAVRALFQRADERAILLAEGDAATVLMRLLKEDAPLRDMVLAVATVGGNLGGRRAVSGPFGERDARDWLDSWFTLDHFDTDLVRLTPYLAVEWLDRSAAVPGVGDLSLESQRFPEPRDDDVERTLEAVDLGPLFPLDDLPRAHVARALIAVVGLWTLTRS